MISRPAVLQDATDLTRLAAADTEITAAVIRARQHGHSWTAIATTLGITRQAAQQRFGNTQTGARSERQTGAK
jgi:hypothetical protein